MKSFKTFSLATLVLVAIIMIPLFDALSYADYFTQYTIMGTEHGDILIGEYMKNNMIKGKAGEDIIIGGMVNDVIYGGEGNDLIDGQAGEDIIVGGTGSDYIMGGAGDDIIFAGEKPDNLEELQERIQKIRSLFEDKKK